MILTPTRKRLLGRVNIRPSGCWQWRGKMAKGGYGATGYRGQRHVLAHRVFYTEFVREIPAGLTVDHLCHNADPDCEGGPTCRHRRCVNPARLEAVTFEVNSARAGMGRRKQCPKKHPYTPENTRTVNGSRFCRTCQRDSSRAAKQRRKDLM